MIRVVNRIFLVALLGISMLCTTHVLTAKAQTAPQVTITKSMPEGETVTTHTQKTVGEDNQQAYYRTTGLKYVEKNSEIIFSITQKTYTEKRQFSKR